MPEGIQVVYPRSRLSLLNAQVCEQIACTRRFPVIGDQLSTLSLFLNKYLIEIVKPLRLPAQAEIERLSLINILVCFVSELRIKTQLMEKLTKGYI